jgi:hypothetical protein
MDIATKRSPAASSGRARRSKMLGARSRVRCGDCEISFPPARAGGSFKGRYRDGIVKN